MCLALDAEKLTMRYVSNTSIGTPTSFECGLDLLCFIMDYAGISSAESIPKKLCAYTGASALKNIYIYIYIYIYKRAVCCKANNSAYTRTLLWPGPDCHTQTLP